MIVDKQNKNNHVDNRNGDIITHDNCHMMNRIDNKSSNKYLMSHLKRPSLRKRNAIHINLISSSKRKDITDMNLDYDLIKNFDKYPLIKYSKIMVQSFINTESENIYIRHGITKHIIHICKQYFCGEKEEIYQLGIKLNYTFKEINQRLITKSMLDLFVKHYLRIKDKDNAKIDFYINKLIEYKCIEMVEIRSKILYKVPMNQQLNFDTFTKYHL